MLRKLMCWLFQMDEKTVDDKYVLLGLAASVIIVAALTGLAFIMFIAGWFIHAAFFS